MTLISLPPVPILLESFGTSFFRTLLHVSVTGVFIVNFEHMLIVKQNLGATNKQ